MPRGKRDQTNITVKINQALFKASTAGLDESSYNRSEKVYREWNDEGKKVKRLMRYSRS